MGQRIEYSVSLADKRSAGALSPADKSGAAQLLQYRDGYNAAIATYYQQQQGTIWPLVAAESKMNIIRDKAIDLYRLRVSTNLAGEEG